MPCYSPLTGYVSRLPSKKGKFPIVFNVRDGWVDRKVSVPCGQCIGCRLDKSRQWAIRCVHEASLYDDNCFITLTFDDDKLDLLRKYKYTRKDHDIDIMRRVVSLYKSDFAAFIKRLRKMFGSGVRYYHCGEYGEQYGRPHHHACLFNFRFPDCKLLDIPGRSKDLPPLYSSKALCELWPFGISTVGDVTYDSAAYVAQYVMKKITGDRADSHYGDCLPEFTTMSRRPGIGRKWYELYKSDCYPSDELVIRGGVVCKPPRYYDSVFAGEDPATMAILKGRRCAEALNDPENHGKRLMVRNKVTLARCKTFLKRRLES